MHTEQKNAHLPGTARMPPKGFKVVVHQDRKKRKDSRGQNKQHINQAQSTNTLYCCLSLLRIHLFIHMYNLI